VTLSGIDPLTFWLIAWRLSQLHYRVPPLLPIRAQEVNKIDSLVCACVQNRNFVCNKIVISLRNSKNCPSWGRGRNKVPPVPLHVDNIHRDVTPFSPLLNASFLPAAVLIMHCVLRQMAGKLNFCSAEQPNHMMRFYGVGWAQVAFTAEPRLSLSRRMMGGRKQEVKFSLCLINWTPTK
jgi:hypothetical protein